MKRANTNKELDAMINRASEQIRNEELDSAVVDNAADRVWARLANQDQQPVAAVDQIRTCADFQALIPTYLHAKLSEARVLLFEDHTRECLSCRKALKEARTHGPQLPQRTNAGRINRGYSIAKWMVAATLIIGLGLIAIPLIKHFTYGPEVVQANVDTIKGSVFRVATVESKPLVVGDALGKGEKIRTARNADAIVRLNDGSLIEMNERSEFSISENARGTTIHLERGNIIIQAAKQRNRHLYVATDDCLVSVTGTIFSVNNGVKGSRVSVVEGEVHVGISGTNHILHSGDQVTSNPNLSSVPVEEEIAWSRDSERYVKLLAALSSLRTEINDKVARPDMRYSTRLLDLMPEGTVLYAALPNISSTIKESQQIVEQRIAENPTLREWWQSNDSLHNEPGIKQLYEKIIEFGSFLGNEIVIGVEMDEKGRPNRPMVLADLINPGGLRPYLEQQINNIKDKNGPTLRFIDNPLTATAQAGNGKEIYIWINGDLLAAAPKLEQLQQLAQYLNNPGSNRFTTTDFYTRIAELYRDGAGLIVAGNLEKIIAVNVEKKGATDKKVATYEKLGLLNLKHFIVEQKMSNKRAHSRAVLTFNETRRGIAAWLAAPGPIGALEFVSPDATMAAAFVVKEPSAVVDELFGYIDTINPKFRQHLNKLETEHGINLRKDIAAPVGGEFVFALDGPVLPTPSWKLVFEVYDPARLQESFEHMVTEINRVAGKEGKFSLKLDRNEINGHVFYALKSSESSLEVNYTFANGYFVAAPSVALLDRAIKHQETGHSLLRSPKFIAALPEDGNANFSALFYHDLAPLLAPIAQQLGNISGLPKDQQAALNSITTSAPTLAYAIAQGDRITFAANSDAGPFGLSPASLIGLPGSLELHNILNKVRNGKLGSH